MSLCQAMDANADHSNSLYIVVRFDDSECEYPDYITIGEQISIKGLTYERQATIISVCDSFNNFVESMSGYKEKMIKKEILEDIHYTTDEHVETSENYAPDAKDDETAKSQEEIVLEEIVLEENQMENCQVLSNNCDIESKLDIVYNGPNVEVKVENDVFITLSPNGSQVPSQIFNSIYWSNYTRATEDLLKSLFNNRSLATRTLTGRRYGKPSIYQLNPKKIEDIVNCVNSRSNVRTGLVRRTISQICIKYKKASTNSIKRKKYKVCSKLLVQYQGDQVVFGPNKSCVSKDIFNSITWRNYIEAIESILSFFSSEIELSNNLNTDIKPNLPELDPKKIEDILYIVNVKTGQDKAHIRFATMKKWSALCEAAVVTTPVSKDLDISGNISFGPHNSMVKKEIFQLIDWRDYAAATRSLHYALKGVRQPTTTRRSIDSERISTNDLITDYQIQDIIHIVAEKCGVSHKLVTDVIYTKEEKRQCRNSKYNKHSLYF